MTYEDLLEATERQLGWRISGENVEFLAYYGEGKDSMARIKGVRPATEQEKALWRLVNSVLRGIASGEVNSNINFVDAHSVKDPFGTPKEN